MSNLFPSSPESEALREQAQREARRQAPPFSQALHSRIMDAIGQTDHKTDDGDAIVPRPRGPFGTIWTIAALAVLAVEVLVVTRDQPAQKPALATNSYDRTQTLAVAEPLAEVSQVQAVPARVTLAMESAASREQWAGLDRDAKTVTKYLVDQVPFQSIWNSSDRQVAGLPAGSPVP